MSLIDTIKAQYIAAVKQANPETNPELVGEDWDVKATAQGVIGAQLTADIQNTGNAAFPQFQSGTQLTYEAFSLGIPPQRGATPAICIITNTIFPVSPITLNAGTQFTSNYNGDVYLLISETTISNFQATPLSLQSQNTGSGLQLPLGTTFSNSTTDAYNYVVTSSSDGENSESDNELRKRILTTMQTPRGAGREGDFIAWAFESDPSTITGVFVIPKFFPNSITIGIFVLSGTANYNEIVLNAAEYSRTATPDTITTANNYINVQRGINQQIFTSSVATYIPPETIEIQVLLPEGVTLNTVTTNFNGDSITVENFILQEFRRGLITYPIGGTLENNVNYILLSRLEQTLDSSLSFYGGVYAQLLIDRKILVDGISQDIVVPYNELNMNNNLIALYDINTVTTSVSLL